MTTMPQPFKTTLRTDPRDAEVGRRLRTQRLTKGLSQTQLGAKIGVTFQQVQKYENGVNRIGAGRLSRIAEALDVPVTFFFFGGSEADSSSQDQQNSPFALLSTAGAIHLVRAYARIQSSCARHALVEIAERLAAAATQPAGKRRRG
jgi:transcriptional regulator with XRE-family HTH domain